MALQASWMQKTTSTAKDARAVLASLVPNPGIVQGFLITQTATASQSVNIQAGRAFVSGTQAGTTGTYFVVNDTTENLTLTAANGSNPRYDLIVLTVRDASSSGTNNDAIFQVVTGTAAASPVAPSKPANSIILARIYVPAASPTVTTSEIEMTNIRDIARLSYSLAPQAIRCLSTARPTQDLANGLLIYETDTGITRMRRGSSWYYLTGDVSSTTIRNVITQDKDEAKAWKINSVNAIIRSGVVQVSISITKKGSRITVPSSGNFANSAIGTLTDTFRPAMGVPTMNLSTGRMIGGYTHSGGPVSVTNVMQGSNHIDAGETFVIGFTAPIRGTIYAS